MAVFRVEKSRDYSVMANFHFRDRNLSWKAKGILSNMLSLPDDWDYSLAGLEKLASDGETSTRSAIKELERKGYLERKPIREKGRITDWEYIIFEKPKEENQVIEEPVVENPQVENQGQYNTNQSTTNQQSTKKSKESKQATFDDLINSFTENEEIRELLGEWLKVRKAKRAAMTNRAIELNLQKLDKLAAESNMSVTEYLKEVICRGWQAFYKINNYSNQKKDNSMNIIKELYQEEEAKENGGMSIWN